MIAPREYARSGYAGGLKIDAPSFPIKQDLSRFVQAAPRSTTAQTGPGGGGAAAGGAPGGSGGGGGSGAPGAPGAPGGAPAGYPAGYGAPAGGYPGGAPAGGPGAPGGPPGAPPGGYTVVPQTVGTPSYPQQWQTQNAWQQQTVSVPVNVVTQPQLSMMYNPPQPTGDLGPMVPVGAGWLSSPGVSSCLTWVVVGAAVAWAAGRLRHGRSA